MPAFAELVVPPSPSDTSSLGDLKERFNMGDPTARAANPVASPEATITETEPNNTPAQANAISLGDIVNGLIDPAGDVDYFQFTGATDQRIFALVSAYVNGSSLDARIELLDSDGTTLLASADDNNGLDPFLMYKLLHSGTFYVKVVNCYSTGGPAYSYALTVGLTGTISGSVGIGANPVDRPRPWIYCPNIDVYWTSGYLYGYTYTCGPGPSSFDFSIEVPSNINLKLSAYEYTQKVGWHNQKGSFSAADPILVPPGGNVAVSANAEFYFGIYPVTSKWNYRVGDVLDVDLRLMSGPASVTSFLAISLLFPEAGTHDFMRTGIASDLYFGPIQLNPNTDYTVQFVRYTLTGGETSGRYGLRAGMMPMPGVSYGSSTLEGYYYYWTDFLVNQ